VKPKPPIISADQAEQIQKARIGVALKKLKDGKSLTLGEQRLIEDVSQTRNEDGQPMGFNSLALELKVGKQALKAALANVPHSGTVNGGHPAWTISEARAALHAHGSKAVNGPLKDQKLQEQIRQLKLINDRKAGTLVERSLVAGAFGRIASRIAEARTQSESQAPLRMVGKDVAEIREEVRKVWDAIGHVLASCAVEFEEKPK
jgi:hypothetical protein